jgi:hypothetical protein
MKLVCTQAEIDNLISLRLLQPISPTSYVLNLRDSKGTTKLKVEVSTEVRDSNNVSVPSLLSLSGNGAYNISE